MSPQEEEYFIRCALKTDHPTLYADGEVKYKHKAIPSLVFLRNLLFKEYPYLEGKVSDRQLQTTLNRAIDADPLTFIHAWHGAREVKEHIAHKVNNDVDKPDDRQQSDARYLPIYVRHNGIVMTIVLVIFVDDFSGYVPRWFVVPRKQEVEPDDIRDVSFTNEHVRAHLADMWRKTRRRSLILYTDNEGVYTAIQRYLNFLDGKGPKLIQSLPGEPWGRGLVEVILKLINKAIKNEPGYVKDYRNVVAWRRAWQAAHSHPDRLLELTTQLMPILDDFFKNWNEKPQGKKGELPSRREIYETTPNAALPCPDELQLAHFAFARTSAFGTLSDNGINYKGKWERVLTDDEAYNVETHHRWAKAVAAAQQTPAKKKVPMYFLETIGKLETVESELYVIASVDGVTWEQVLPKGEQKTSGAAHVGRRNEAIGADASDIRAMVEPLEEHMREKYGGDLIRVYGMKQQVVAPNELPNTAKPRRQRKQPQPSGQEDGVPPSQPEEPPISNSTEVSSLVETEDMLDQTLDDRPPSQSAPTAQISEIQASVQPSGTGDDSEQAREHEPPSAPDPTTEASSSSGVNAFELARRRREELQRRRKQEGGE